MDFNQYQAWTNSTAIYDNHLYPVLGLTEEAGEVAGKVAKALRDKHAVDGEMLKKELGDVLWMLARVADDFGITLEEVAQTNYNKLEDRKRRSKLSGEGDNR